MLTFRSCSQFMDKVFKARLKTFWHTFLNGCKFWSVPWITKAIHGLQVFFVAIEQRLLFHQNEKWTLSPGGSRACWSKRLYRATLLVRMLHCRLLNRSITREAFPCSYPLTPSTQLESCVFQVSCLTRTGVELTRMTDPLYHAAGCQGCLFDIRDFSIRAAVTEWRCGCRP